MRDATIARNYASALYELGEAHGEVEGFAVAFRELDAALAADGGPVRRFLGTPKVDLEAKQRVLGEALGGRVPERFLHFVLVVLSKRRQGLLSGIRAAYEEIVDQKAGRVMADVTLARKPDAATVEAIADRLSTIIGKDVVPQVTVDPAILGGLVVRYGDRRIDGSMRRQLLSLKREMMHARLPELPAGSA